jgi:hypothetical protein
MQAERMLNFYNSVLARAEYPATTLKLNSPVSN